MSQDFHSQDFSQLIEVIHTQGVYLHQFGVMTCVNNDPHNPLSVPELGATKQHLVRAQGSWTGDEQRKYEHEK